MNNTIDYSESLYRYVLWLKMRGLTGPLRHFSDRDSLDFELPLHPNCAEATFTDAMNCRKCTIAACKPGTSWGFGSPAPTIMFIGDSPTREAASLSRPLAGPEFELFCKIMKAMKLGDDDWYLMNLLQCPVPSEKQPYIHKYFKNCLPYTWGKIQSLKPQILVLLGKTVESYFNSLKLDYPLNPQPFIYQTVHMRELIMEPTLKKPFWEQMQHIKRQIL